MMATAIDPTIVSTCPSSPEMVEFTARGGKTLLWLRHIDRDSVQANKGCSKYRIFVKALVRSISTILLGIFFTLQGCAPDAPLVIGETGTALPYKIVVASGICDGYYLNAELALFPPDLITGLHLQLSIEIATQPKLLEATWTLGTESGSIAADWLGFFGGQGGSPIIAGRFLLHPGLVDTITTFIVNLPKTEIKRQGVGFQGGKVRCLKKNVASIIFPLLQQHHLDGVGKRSKVWGQVRSQANR